MKYVILHYFFMAHLCNIKMSANTIRHKSSREAYDIEGFINQLLASRKFDELAEKVADKAAVRIMKIEAAPVRLERFSDVNKLNKTTENTQKSYRDQPIRDFEKGALDNFKLRNDNGQDKQGKIDTQAVMMDENTSQSNSLKLKYKYLTRNAYEKKVFSDRGSDKDQPKRNEISEEKFRDHDTKAEERTHQDTSEKNQHSSSKNEFIDENSRWRHDNRGDDRADLDSNRKDKSHIKSHVGSDGEGNEKNKKTHQREDQDIRRDTIEAQNSRPEFKSIAKNEAHEVGRVDNSTEEEKVESSSKEEVIVKIVPSSEEKASKEVEKTEEEPEKSSSDENIAKENDEVSPVKLRSKDETDDPDIDENKITSDNQQEGAAYGYVYKSEERKEQVAEEPKSEEQGTKEQETEEEKAEAQGTEEQHTAEQKTQDENDSSEEEKPPAPHKPVIRREGNKLYTYVEAPEYQEYHEQMAKMQEEHPVNPSDFL